MGYSNISLRIAGTKQRQAGFAPLVSVGVLAGGEGDNMDRVPCVAEKPAYILKHASDYILYQLIDRQVKSFDADASGVLSIALTIPSNMQLANNVSPYRLLREVYETYLKTYMDHLSDGRDSFKNTDNDSELFRSILTQYPLEERKSAYITMNPQGLTGIVCVSPNDIEDFFCNTQYREFASFKDIEIGISCHEYVSTGLERLQIPLPSAVYEVWVNGQRTGATMQFPMDTYSSNIVSTKYYDYENVDFSLEELLNAPDNRLLKNNAVIFLDFKSNRVICELKKKEIYYNLLYVYEGNVENAKHIIEEAICRGNVRLLMDGQDVSQTIFKSSSVPASRGENVKIQISPAVISSYSFHSTTRIESAKRQFIIKIIINKKEIQTPQRVVRTQKSDNIKTSMKLDTPDNANMEVQGSSDKVFQTKKKKSFDLNSFILGLIVGIFVCLCIWLLSSQFGGKSNQPQQENEQHTTDTTIINTAFSNNPNEELGMEETSVQGDDAGVESAEEQVNKQEEEKLRSEQKAREAEEKAENKRQKEEKRKQILSLVNQKKLNDIRAIWDNENVLTQNEKNAVEAILDMTKYKGATLKNVEKFLKEKNFKDFEDIKNASAKIQQIIKETQTPPSN